MKQKKPRERSLPIAILISFRPSQWIKNLSVFAAIIFTGELFHPLHFQHSLLAFFIFCLLSSSSYLINDTIDAPLDRLHPVKKNRPIAKGELPIPLAIFLSLILALFSLTLAFSLGFGFVFTCLLFIFTHYAYSFILKKKAIYDILGIAASFIIRALAGETATGFHMPVWLLFSLIFLALFIATGKRRSELVGPTKATARPALRRYQKSLLNFYTSIFAVSTIIAYALFTFSSQPVSFQGYFRSFILQNFPDLMNRKLMMITLGPVIFGIMRYGQIIFETTEGERPERMIASDIPLALSVFLWGAMTIAFIYVF